MMRMWSSREGWLGPALKRVVGEEEAGGDPRSGQRERSSPRRAPCHCPGSCGTWPSLSPLGRPVSQLSLGMGLDPWSLLCLSSTGKGAVALQAASWLLG